MHHTFSPSNPCVPSLPSLPGIPYRRHQIWNPWLWELVYIEMLNLSDMYLQAPPWVLLPLDLLWDQFYPIERHNNENTIHLIDTHLNNSHNSRSYTYNFSFGSSESLWSFFPSITLETSDETHTAIHWLDQPTLLAVYVTTKPYFCWKCVSNKETLTVFPMMPGMPGLPLNPGRPWRQAAWGQTKHLNVWASEWF